MRYKAGLAVALALAAPLAAEAQSYRCIDKDGRKYYGSTIPPQCAGVAVEQLSPQGKVVGRIEPRPAAAPAPAEAEAPRKRDEDAAARDATRRNRALLATYQSEKDIEDARARALADNRKASEEAEARIAEITQRLEAYEREANPARGKPSAKLFEDIDHARIELKAQQTLLAAKRKEAGTINARYDEDARRYRELSAMDPAARGKALGMEKGITVTTKPPSAQELRRQEYEARRNAARDRAELQRIERERENELRRAEYQRRRLEREQRLREREQQ